MTKKAIILALILFFSLIPIYSEASEKTVTYEYIFSDLSIEKIYNEHGMFSVVSIDDLQSNNELGLPSLPYKTASILLPVGKTIKSMYVSYDFNSTMTLANPVVPMQKFQPVGEKKNNTFHYDINHYKKNHFEFNELVTTNIQYSHGYPILILNMRPVNYNPKTNELVYYDKISFTLNFKDTPVSSFYRNLESDEEYIKTIVDNPQDFYPMDYKNIYDGGLCNSSEKYDGVIITTQSLNISWQPLINHRKTFSNLDYVTVTWQDIDACSDYWNSTPLFNDTQAHIREFLKDAYQDWEINYVILGGDWDSIYQIVPYRLFTDIEEEHGIDTMPCDMYFSHLDGDWYYDASSVWGGGIGDNTNDYYAELYLGRITAHDETTVQNAIDKIIWYDNHLFDKDWSNKIAFWGGNLGWTATSKQYMEELRLGTDTYRNFTGYEEWNDNTTYYDMDTSERLYHADLGISYKTYWVNSIQNNNFAVVNHLDHSDWNIPFSLSNWATIYNTHPFFGYTQGCFAGRFSSGAAGCEQMMCSYPDRHAYALILNTGYGYGSSTTTDGPGQYLNCMFWDYFFNATSNNLDSWQLGKAQQYSKDKMSGFISENHAICYNWYSTHYFGDPAQTWYNPMILQPMNNSDYESVYDTSLIRTAETANGTISFYWGNNTFMGNVTNLIKGELAVFNITEPIWLNHDTIYYWYVIENSSQSPTYNFHTSYAWDCIEDKTVDFLDISALSGVYGGTVTPGSIGPDINNDGEIDYLDASSLSGHYGMIL